jgi:hypothetical protein
MLYQILPITGNKVGAILNLFLRCTLHPLPLSSHISSTLQARVGIVRVSSVPPASSSFRIHSCIQVGGDCKMWRFLFRLVTSDAVCLQGPVYKNGWEFKYQFPWSVLDFNIWRHLLLAYVHRRFGGTYRPLSSEGSYFYWLLTGLYLKFPTRGTLSSSPVSSCAYVTTLKMEALRSSETSVNCSITWRNVQDDCTSYRWENLNTTGLLISSRRCIVFPVRYEQNLYMLCRRK